MPDTATAPKTRRPALPHVEAARRLNEALTYMHESGPTPAIAAALGNLAGHPHAVISRWARRAIAEHAMELALAIDRRRRSA